MAAIIVLFSKNFFMMFVIFLSFLMSACAFPTCVQIQGWPLIINLSISYQGCSNLSISKYDVLQQNIKGLSALLHPNVILTAEGLCEGGVSMLFFPEACSSERMFPRKRHQISWRDEPWRGIRPRRLDRDHSTQQGQTPWIWMSFQTGQDRVGGQDTETEEQGNTFQS